jgi:hypothetical protein
VSAPSVALWQTSTEPQKSLRMGLAGLLGGPVALFAGGISPTTGGGSHGVVGTGDFAASVPSNSLVVTVGVGQCFVHGTSSIDQGTYYWYQNAASSADTTLAAYNTQARTDLIGVQVRDNAEDSSGATTCKLDKVTGTPGGGVPTVPAGFLVLYQAAVPANSGTVVLTDKRTYAAGIGGLIRCRSTTRPTGAALWQGQVIYELDTDRVWAYSGAATWVLMLGRVRFLGTNSGGTTYNAGDYLPFPWTSEGEDTDSMHSGTSTTVTCTVPGTYTVSFEAFSSITPSADSILEILRSGTIRSEGQIRAGRQRGMAHLSCYLGVGDTIVCNFKNNHSAPVFVTGTLDMFRTGP